MLMVHAPGSLGKSALRWWHWCTAALLVHVLLLMAPAACYYQHVEQHITVVAQPFNDRNACKHVVTHFHTVNSSGSSR